MMAREENRAQVDIISDPDADDAIARQILPTTSLPAHREQGWHAWLPIMTGCNNHCAYCVVPSVRGREVSRPFAEILHDVEALLDDGVIEITLLGQNVNSYGRDLYGKPRFAEVLRAVGNSGVQRLRFTTSHPRDLSEETIAAFAETPAVMPHLQLPFQSGSDSILRAMNRSYSADHYRNLVRAVRVACAAAGKGDGTEQGSVALSTDIIVGFPGETEEDFQATMELTEEIGFAQAYTFIYSRREGTPAALLEDNTPAEVIQNRYQRLVEVVQQSAWKNNQLELGRQVPVLFEGVSKRDSKMLSGRSPKNTVVHVPLQNETEASRSRDDSTLAEKAYVGRVLPVLIDTARTWYLRGELVETGR
jgi:tRNA-2-methylthio-N6-dimethylallyladenosine synthase